MLNDWNNTMLRVKENLEIHIKSIKSKLYSKQYKDEPEKLALLNELQKAENKLIDIKSKYESR